MTAAFPLSGVTAYLTHKILVKTHKKERQCVKWRKGFSGRRTISYGCASNFYCDATSAI